MGISARDVLGRDPDGFFVIATQHADQAGIIIGKLVGARLHFIQQLSERRIDETLVRKPSQQSQLPTPRHGAPIDLTRPGEALRRDVAGPER